MHNNCFLKVERKWSRLHNLNTNVTEQSKCFIIIIIIVIIIIIIIIIIINHLFRLLFRKNLYLMHQFAFQS